MNFVLKARATRYVASISRGGLYPENSIGVPRWCDIDRIFYTRFRSFRTQNELMVRYKDGGVMHSNAFGERDHVPGWFVRQQDAKRKSKGSL